ncbi:Ig-like domain-containing protein, partial [Tsuneonella sp. SYSU-LHT278]|uniref:Ig-like domain-containing protein n=1 Tax=Tsuneonella sediminis TaxID=3416089 RepID=UPI003F7A5FA5
TAPDFEVPTDADTNNTYIVTVRATDGNGNTSSQTITVTVLDLDDTAPVVAAGQSFAYAENQSAGAVLGTVAASDAVGVTGFRFAATGTATSADGYYAISSAGVITLTAAGAAAGAPSNDFETAPNSFVHGVEARDAAGNWSAAADVTLAVTDLDDAAPVITGPSGGAGATASAISVNENQTAVTTLTADKAVTWAITGGADGGQFSVSPSGVITFNTAPDFEVPTDADTNNTYIVTVRATDGNGNTSSQTITVTVLDLPDSPPVLLGPGGSTGPEASISVPEGSTLVATLSANVPISNWAIVGGNDRALFAISPTGALSFTSPPDFERPADSTQSNTYVLVIEATDANGNRTRQTVTVTVTDIADTPPAITGPSGSAGAATSSVTVNEGSTEVTQLGANVPVTWSIVGGDDRAQFAITPTGIVTFVAAPDFESPTDSDRNNVYTLVVQARDQHGNTSSQTITVTVVNVDEIQQKLDEIGGSLRRDLRNHAFSSLSTMLAFNEDLIGLDDTCASAGDRKLLSGGVQADERQQQAGVGISRDLSSCESRTRVFIDGGLAFTRVDGNWANRGLASARFERRAGERTVLGAALVGTAAKGDLAAFDDSKVSDQSLQLNVYGRTYLADALRFAAFAGWGRAWYSFELADDGFAANGEMTGKRHLYGAALSGDIIVGATSITTDAILSRAVERLGSSKLEASAGGESRSGILFDVGTVDITRLSLPVHLAHVFGQPADGRDATRLDVSPGVLCQDIAQDSSALTCGYQLGLGFRHAPSLNTILRGEARFESVGGYLLHRFTVGFERRIFGERPISVGLDLGRSAGGAQADNRVLVRFGLSP